MPYVVTCLDSPDKPGLRQRLRATHLQYMIAHRARVLTGGPLLGEADTPVGSVMALDFTTKSEVEAFLSQEPYTLGGLFETVLIHKWRQMVPELVPNALGRELEAELSHA